MPVTQAAPEHVAREHVGHVVHASVRQGEAVQAVARILVQTQERPPGVLHGDEDEAEARGGESEDGAEDQRPRAEARGRTGRSDLSRQERAAVRPA